MEKDSNSLGVHERKHHFKPDCSSKAGKTDVFERNSRAKTAALRDTLDVGKWKQEAPGLWFAGLNEF